MNLDIKKTSPFIIAIAGGSGSGKKTISNAIAQELLKQHNIFIPVISLELYYKQSDEYPAPDAVDWDKIRSSLLCLKLGENVILPDNTTKISPEPVMILEGCYALHKNIIDYVNYGIFIDCDRDTALVRKVRQLCIEHQKNLLNILDIYEKHVIEEYKKNILPTRRAADISMDNGYGKLIKCDIALVAMIKSISSVQH